MCYGNVQSTLGALGVHPGETQRRLNLDTVLQVVPVVAFGHSLAGIAAASSRVLGVDSVPQTKGPASLPGLEDPPRSALR